MLTEYSGYEYLMIDVANQYKDLDKELFETRIQWVKDNMDHLEEMIVDVKPKVKPLYYKACMALRKAQQKQAIGHMVGLDASCSGIQVMSALTGCITGATNTGLVDPNVRADAYSTCTQHMSTELGGFSIERSLAKDALMTSFYGSEQRPEDIFGKDNPELMAFYVAAQKTAPGAWNLLQELKAAWQPFALVHEWRLPDGFLARVRVKEKITARITVDEMAKASFTYQFKEYMGTKTGISLAANSVHSTDAYVLRCMIRRCNYDETMVKQALQMIESELQAREDGGYQYGTPSKQVQYYLDLYEASGMPDVVILPALVKYKDCVVLSTEHLNQLASIIYSMLEHKPFEIITIHDAFHAHPNNLNHVRKHYREIFAQMAESTMLESILNQITNNPQGKYQKLSKNLGDLIRQSNYSLC